MLVPFAPDDIVCLVAGITDISLKEFMKIVLFIEILVCGYLQLLNVVFVSIIWQIITKDNKTNVWFCCLFFLD